MSFASPILPLGSTGPAAKGLGINETAGRLQQPDYSRWPRPLVAAQGFSWQGSPLSPDGELWKADGFARPLELFFRQLPSPLADFSFPSNYQNWYKSIGASPSLLAQTDSVRVGSASDPAVSSGLSPQSDDTVDLFLQSMHFAENQPGFQFESNPTKYPLEGSIASAALITAAGANQQPYLPAAAASSVDQGSLFWSTGTAEQRAMGHHLDPSYGVGSQSLGLPGDRYCSTARVGLSSLEYRDSQGHVPPFAPSGLGVADPASVSHNPREPLLCSDGFPVQGLSSSRLIANKRKKASYPKSSMAAIPPIPPEYSSFLVKATTNQAAAAEWTPATEEQRWRGVVAGPAMAHTASDLTAAAAAISRLTASTPDGALTEPRSLANTPAVRPTAAIGLNFAGPTELNFSSDDFPLRERGVILFTRIGCDVQRDLSETTPDKQSVKSSYSDRRFMAVEVMSNSIFVPLARATSGASFTQRKSGYLVSPLNSTQGRILYNPYSYIASASLPDVNGAFGLSSLLLPLRPAGTEGDLPLDLSTMEKLPPAALFAHRGGKIKDYIETRQALEISNPLYTSPADEDLAAPTLIKLPVTADASWPAPGGGTRSARLGHFYEYQLGSMYIPPHLGVLFVDSDGLPRGKSNARLSGAPPVTDPRFSGFFASVVNKLDTADYWVAEDAPAGDGSFAVLDQFFLPEPISVSLLDPATNQTKTGKTFDPRYLTGVLVFDRVDSAFMNAFALSAPPTVFLQAASPLPALVSVNKQQTLNYDNYLRLLSGAFKYFTESSLSLTLFPNSLLPSAKAPAGLSVSDVSRVPSARWLVVMLTFVCAFRYPGRAPDQADDTPYGKVAGRSITDLYERQARFVGGTRDLGSLRCVVQADPLVTVADLFMVHYATAYLGAFYASGKAPLYTPTVPFDSTCACLQYAGQQLCFGRLPSSLAGAFDNPNFRAFVCYAAQSNSLCFDNQCSKNQMPAPYYFARYNSSGPCTDRNVSIYVDSTVCTALDFIDAGASSIVIDNISIVNQCASQEPFAGCPNLNDQNYCTKPNASPYKGKLYVAKSSAPRALQLMPIVIYTATPSALSQLRDIADSALYRSQSLKPLQPGDVYPGYDGDLLLLQASSSGEVDELPWSASSGKTGTVSSTGFARVDGRLVACAAFTTCEAAPVPLLLLRSLAGSDRFLWAEKALADLAPAADSRVVVGGSVFATDSRGFVVDQVPCSGAVRQLFQFATSPGPTFGDKSQFCACSEFFLDSQGTRPVTGVESLKLGSESVKLDASSGRVTGGCEAGLGWWPLLVIVLILLALVVASVVLWRKAQKTIR